MSLEKTLLQNRKKISLTELEKARAAIEEELRAKGIQQQAGSGIQGGFTKDNQVVLQQESRQAVSDIEKEYQSELDIFNKVERKKQEAEDEAKNNSLWSNVLKIGGTAAGIGVGILTAGAATPLLTAMATGAGLGLGVGSLASGLLGYDDLQAGDVSQIMQGLGMMNEQMKASDYQDLLRRQQWAENTQIAPKIPLGFKAGLYD